MVTQTFGDQGRFQRTETATAVGFVDQQAGHTQLSQRRPYVGRARLLLFGKQARAREWRVIGQQARDTLGQQGLFVGKSEIHGRFSSQASFGSRGMPSPRSAMMFFWICAVPPPMMRPRKYM